MGKAGFAGVYEVGQLVEVHAFGRWYKGHVVAVGPVRVAVEYASGTGTVRVKRVHGDKVRAVAGVEVRS